MSKARSFTAEAAGGAAARVVVVSDRARRVGIYFAVALAVFLLGLVPMWVRARAAASQRDAARRELRLSQLQGTLASAAIDARRGEYEPARQTASEFFKTLRSQLDAGGDSALTKRQGRSSGSSSSSTSPSSSRSPRASLNTSGGTGRRRSRS